VPCNSKSTAFWSARGKQELACPFSSELKRGKVGLCRRNGNFNTLSCDDEKNLPEMSDNQGPRVFNLSGSAHLHALATFRVGILWLPPRATPSPPIGANCWKCSQLPINFFSRKQEWSKFFCSAHFLYICDCIFLWKKF